jgi:ABC-type phosphate transport system substrate-binding protein
MEVSMLLRRVSRVIALGLGLTLIGPVAAPTNEKIVIDGSTGVMPLVAELAKAYRERHAAAVVELAAPPAPPSSAPTARYP